MSTGTAVGKLLPLHLRRLQGLYSKNIYSSFTSSFHSSLTEILTYIKGDFRKQCSIHEALHAILKSNFLHTWHSYKSPSTRFLVVRKHPQNCASQPPMPVEGKDQGRTYVGKLRTSGLLGQRFGVGQTTTVPFLDPDSQPGCFTEDTSATAPKLLSYCDKGVR